MMFKYLAANTRSHALALLGFSLLLMMFAVSTAQAITTSFTHFSAGIMPDSAPTKIATGPDQRIWFTEADAGKLAQIGPEGEVTEYSVSSRGEITDLVPGPNGEVWFTENISGKLGRMSPSGTVRHIPAGTSPDVRPQNLTNGPDGNIWLTDFPNDRIVRVTPGGTATEFALDFGTRPLDITPGSDGALWFTESGTDTIGRITTAGVVTEFGGMEAGSYPVNIVEGVDGALWFTEYSAKKIGRITTDGKITEYSDGMSETAGPMGISRGPNGNIWFTDVNDKIGQITPSGEITEFYDGVSVDTSPVDITAGSNDNLWFTEPTAGRIGRLTVGPDKDQATVSENSTATATDSVTELPGTNSEVVISSEKAAKDIADPVATLTRPRCVRSAKKSAAAIRRFAKCKKTERRRLLTARRYQTLKGVVSDAPYSAGVKNGYVFVRLISKVNSRCRALRNGRLTKLMSCKKARTIWSKTRPLGEIRSNGGSTKWRLKARGLKKGMKLSGLVYAIDSAGNGGKRQAKPFTLRLTH